MSVEDAVAKAKAIAAKLTGSTSNGSDNAVNALDVAKAAEAALAGLVEPSTKRKRWDEDPEEDSKKSKGEASRRLWIATKDKPASHYRLYWEQHGASITNQVSAGDIYLELKGRGSSATAALPGIPEEPLHLLIQGPTVESCESAEPLVDQLFIQKADQAALLAEDSPQESSQNAVAATTSSGYRPAPVASLIHNVNNGTNNVPDGQLFEEQIGVPNGLVGYIIGRGGESISSMQARTGAKVQIQREAEMAPGATQRVITLSGTTKQAIDACRSIIERMVQDRTNSTQQSQQQRGSFAASVNASSQEARLQQAVEAGHVLVKVAVPNTDVGLIIGKAGTTIKSIQDRSGANIQIPQSGDVDNPSIRTVSITHPHGEGAQLAKQLIEDVLGSKKNQAAHVTIQVEIPDKDVGMCIGRSGCVIREMQNQSGTKIQIPSVPTPGQPSRIATVFGPPEGCDKVKQMIERIVLEQSSQSVMSGQQQQPGYGDAYGQYGQQQQQGYGGATYDQQQQAAYGYQQQQAPQAQQAGYNGVQQAGQQDYSKEWAAYYAAQGASQGGTAAAASQPAAAAAPQAAAASPSPAPAGQQGSDAYHEQFHRYAYYYGEEAARNHYGAWSPPPGTPNPYGVNPNGITAPPASSEPAPTASAPVALAPSPAQAPAVDPSSVRDTGRRGVSNLPAWMTKS